MPAIEKVMKAFGIAYPVCIDVPPAKDAQAWGLVYSQYGIRAIPDSVLVDERGIVVAHGPLGMMLGKARELVEEGK